jgi:hypothetical protein
MRISRRRLLGSMLSGLCLNTSAVALGVPGDNVDDWEATCTQWMRVLIPVDEHGAGADSPETWARIHQLIEESEELGSTLKQGFTLLKQQPFPENPEELSALLLLRSDEGRFLRYFFDLLADIYYGSGSGWHDLGLESPPQPHGFHLPRAKG